MSTITLWMLSIALSVAVGALAAHYDTEAEAPHPATTTAPARPAP